MNDERIDLLMEVKGMTCDGCANAVRRAVQRLDAGAEVEVDRAHERVSIRTSAQALEIADAINRAGYEARAMTL
ncbi:heavy-metal-associated domain-containing protein [Salinarimonas soli]|uniref:Heavy-metal-associated domain-containing protein n=1 Tax=Salinarimonas soli TaxID=1638099 RepID=A0A5B2V9P4_9HYPH|nr:heavy metal-associated domain-containing protein [Salinarimonas soli]KAA2235102.1 heavy-metal-associated domain-containing protein [Salinarimonas soli]